LLYVGQEHQTDSRGLFPNINERIGPCRKCAENFLLKSKYAFKNEINGSVNRFKSHIALETSQYLLPGKMPGHAKRRPRALLDRGQRPKLLLVFASILKISVVKMAIFSKFY
jgi:hypothetical protein